MSSSLVRDTLVFGAMLAARGRYPVTVDNCGVSNNYSAAPTKVITMNQGATEFMLAMGLEGSMVGTAYIDDAIWPRYAAAYVTIPILSSSYPNETHIMAQSPDFMVASYSSAFRAQYTRADGPVRGIFSEETIGPCTGTGSDWGKDWTTCRPQLHANGIGTYLLEDACEDSSLRPTTVTEETVYKEMRALGSVFNVSVEPLIDEMKQDFDQAAGLVSAGMSGAPLKTVWLDCVGRCCKTPEGQEQQVFVGGGTGAPNMLMEEAGLSNVFSDRSGNWVCVNVSDIVAASPDVIVLADAAWDTAISKIHWLYDNPEFCQLEVLQKARFVSIPFSATTLGPRNGPAAYDLAVAALHVRTGQQTATRESGVGSLNPFLLQAETVCRLCTLTMAEVVYTDESDDQGFTLCTTVSTTKTSTTAVAATTAAASATAAAATTAGVSNEVARAGRVGLDLFCWVVVAALAAVRPRAAQA